ncbi:unnamed protein product [Kuraishia capsulata CBS 1993]|uniref:Major facilitator superfamily (MFS) profile domain-containing protein n=1 Tax=Kuraishia capsulata CBS 1993 TaxID=1382522 RepID=W6MT28_9ASCO|nr:uncharacterized protein KUCA_T00005883001 [Kuraishia capsulata CBS 1993]CDK29889.1 unnamed protein product [Kuraishia capsulata CBS 1993]
MGLGIWEPKGSPNVTGTIQMSLHKEEDQDETKQNSVAPNADGNPNTLNLVAVASSTAHSATTTLKTTKKGIVLHPQPHDNPNDPLNWPLWRRDMALIVLGFHCFIGGGQTPILAAGMTKIAKEFDKSPSNTSYLVGGFMLSLGFGSLFAAPTAILYGKRIIYLLGIVLAFGGAIWGACANSFGSLMGARVLMGIGFSPCESLPSATIAEIYFSHERAYRLGFYTMLLLGGKHLVPLLSGFVFDKLTRHWLFWIVAIIVGINLVLTVFFVPETFWDRTPTPNKRSQEETRQARQVAAERLRDALRRQDSFVSNHVPNSFAIPKPEEDDSLSINSLDSSLHNRTNLEIDPEARPVGLSHFTEPATTLSHDSVRKKTFLQELHVFSGRHTQDHWWMVFLRPFVLCAYPNVLYGSLIYTFAVVWLILISETISHLFVADPYDYSPTIIGLFYVAPFVGSILGSSIAGRLSDILVRKMVDRNDGVYEPEFRLVMIIPVFFTVVIGLMGFGWATQAHDLWIVPVVFFGILGFGCSLASTTAITYTVDCYRVFAAEGLVTLNVMKNVVGFLFSLFNNSFVDTKGSKTAFVTFGGIQIFLCLLGLGMYRYGKVLRRWNDEKEFMRYLYVKRE